MKNCDENPFSHEGAGTKLVQFASEIPAQWLRCERNFSEREKFWLLELAKIGSKLWEQNKKEGILKA